MVKLKASESKDDSGSKSNPKEGKQMIDAQPSATISTTKFHPSEPEEQEEGEHLFHSQMWVKEAPLHFIVDRGSQKNLISIDVLKWMDLLMKPQPHPCTIG
jgi:hypothetical protein